MKKAQENTSPSIVSGPVAAVSSLIIPGLGQILAGKIRRGILLLSSFSSMFVILFWRIHLLAHREVGMYAKLQKAFSRRPLFVGFLFLCAFFLWLLNAWDAQQQTKGKRSPAIFILIIVIFFVMGWQISEIDIYKMVAEFPDAVPPLSKVLWPWQAAVSREAEEISAGLEILIGCEDELPPLPEEVEGLPYLLAEHADGSLAGAQLPHDQAHQRALASPVGTHQARDAVADGRGHVVQADDLAVPFRQTVEFDHRHRWQPVTRSQSSVLSSQWPAVSDGPSAPHSLD